MKKEIQVIQAHLIQQNIVKDVKVIYKQIGTKIKLEKVNKKVNLILELI